PRYIRRAAQAGLTGQVATRISPGGGLRASLNLYRTGSEDMTERTLRLAELFAVQAGVALNHAHTEATLRLALTTRHTIGQAIGIVRERFGLTEDQAVAYLTRISQHTNTKLRDVAEQITTSVDDQSESG
ncbi:MAG: ANTAR domain-containing protein, partial [Marmoricola sp.]